MAPHGKLSPAWPDPSRSLPARRDFLGPPCLVRVHVVAGHGDRGQLQERYALPSSNSRFTNGRRRSPGVFTPRRTGKQASIEDAHRGGVETREDFGPSQDQSSVETTWSLCVANLKSILLCIEEPQPGARYKERCNALPENEAKTGDGWQF